MKCSDVSIENPAENPVVGDLPAPDGGNTHAEKVPEHQVRISKQRWPIQLTLFEELPAPVDGTEVTTPAAPAPQLVTTQRRTMPYLYDDGGRGAAGFRGEARDCVCRAIAIASGLGYREVYDALNGLGKKERLTKTRRRRSSSRTGVSKRTYERYLKTIGFTWTSAMQIGSGCKVHLCAGELPQGRLVVRVSHHMTAVIDGVIHDIRDPSRGGTRCVYGYFTAPHVSADGYRSH